MQSGGRCGWFYRVLRSGMVTPGDELKLVQRHYPELTVARLLQWYFGDPGASRVAPDDGLRRALPALAQDSGETPVQRRGGRLGAARTVGLPGACLLSDYLITLSQSGRLLASMTVSAARFAEVRELMRQRFPPATASNCASKRAGKASAAGAGPQGVRLLAVEYMTEELKDG